MLGEPVDTGFFDPGRVAEPLELPGVTNATHVFLSVFKWEARKGWDVLLEAFFREFQADEDVVLVLLTNAYHSTSDFQGEVRRFATSRGLDLNALPPVIIQPQVAQQDLPSLYAAADAFVLPSRGEGWGRPHVEAMAMALPIIATNWSGPTEYLTTANGYPVAIRGLVPIPDGPFAGHQWADPSIADLQANMRRVFSDPQEARERGRQARLDMIEKYSPQVLGGQALALLSELTARVKPDQLGARSGATRRHDSQTGEL